MKRIILTAIAVLVLLMFMGFPGSSVEPLSVRANELVLSPVDDDNGGGDSGGDTGGPPNEIDTGDDDAFGDEIIMPHDADGDHRHGVFEIILIQWLVLGGWI